jgi:hypothetical protein
VAPTNDKEDLEKMKKKSCSRRKPREKEREKKKQAQRGVFGGVKKLPHIFVRRVATYLYSRTPNHARVYGN